jgi:hypothetical protein
MRDGLPCETLMGRDAWATTDWPDFKDASNVFRIPPEPRLVAREFWIEDYEDGGPLSVTTTPRSAAIHVREVLPDEVTLRKMTDAEVSQLAMKTDTTMGAARSIALALGLLKESGS